MRNTCRPILVTLLLLLSYSLSAVERSLLNQHIPQPEKVGEGSLTYLFWHVYDATLYASEGQWQPEEPHALSLTYQRSL